MTRLILAALVALSSASCAFYSYSERSTDPETGVVDERDLTVLSTRAIGEVEAAVGDVKVRAGEVDPGINAEELDVLAEAVVTAIKRGGE